MHLFFCNYLLPPCTHFFHHLAVQYENKLSETAVQTFVRWINHDGYGGNDETYEITNMLRTTNLDTDTKGGLRSSPDREQRELASLFGFHAASTNSATIRKPSWLLKRCEELGEKSKTEDTNMPQPYAVHMQHPRSLARLRRSAMIKGILRSFDEQIVKPFYPINRALIMEVVPPRYRIFADMPWMQVGKTGGSTTGMNKIHIDQYR